MCQIYRFLYIYLAMTSDCLFCSYTEVDFFFFPSLKNLLILVTTSVFFLFIRFVFELASSSVFTYFVRLSSGRLPSRESYFFFMFMLRPSLWLFDYSRYLEALRTGLWRRFLYRVFVADYGYRYLI